MPSGCGIHNLRLHLIIIICFVLLLRSSSFLAQQTPECIASTAFILTDCLLSLDDSLNEIDLSRRSISLIPHGAFTKFQELTILDLSHNLLRSVPQSAFSGLTKLHKLKLNNNLIETLIGPEWISFIPKLNELQLHPNNFLCDCSMTWLVPLLATDDVIQDAAHVRCMGPPPLANLLMKNMPAHYTQLLCTTPGQQENFCPAKGMFPCTISLDRSQTGCILHEKLCDGVPDCAPPGADENPFICNTIRQVPIVNRLPPLLPSSFLPMPNLFNGFARAPMFITAPPIKPHFCRSGMFPCWSGGICISWQLVCNGKADCSDGADEQNSQCSAVSATTQKPAEISTAAVTLLPSVTSTTPAVESTVRSNLNIDMSIVKSFLEEMRANSTLNWLTRLESFSLPGSHDFPPLLHQNSTTTEVTTTVSTMSVTQQPVVFRLSELSKHKIEAPSVDPDHPIQEETTEQASHPTITFPQMMGNAHVNSFPNGFTMPEQSQIIKSAAFNSEVSELPVQSTTTDVLMTVRPKITVATKGKTNEGDERKPRDVHISNLPHNEVSVAWSPPKIPLGLEAWDLVAYSVVCAIENAEAGPKVRKKKSPLLSPLVHEHIFHNILPDDSLKVTVTATYRDKDDQTHETVSEPVLRKPVVSLHHHHPAKDALAVTSAKQANGLAGKMSFEDTMGLSVGGVIACVMMILLGVYLVKRKKTNLGHLQGTNVRALRMRKVDRYAPHVKNDRTLSSEPIYAEPENGYHEIDAPHPGHPSVLALTTGPVEPSWNLQTIARHGHGTMIPVNAEDGYVEVLDSADSAYYGHGGRGPTPGGPFSTCSEYSCYSVAASGNHVIVDPRMTAAPPSQSSSFAVYTDSENCSASYGVGGAYHNSNHPPLQRMSQHLQQQMQAEMAEMEKRKMKQFGDTVGHSRGVACLNAHCDGFEHTENGRGEWRNEPVLNADIGGPRGVCME
ncbi:hypothetical protein BV898_12147 [Hypsibius exemplaris]|uniref:Fibronectin type-III domain-containing protein n=1 Tax=Hypsibius exemplaris TaxID=2072580 RepID=A0A1W0WEG1_HYPEX|nr:hypothetical protein BV898_12147 [Hypsibius exemplaris]